MIRAIALDDEPPALSVLESFCNKVDYIELVKTFTNPREAHTYLNKFPVDLIFLDIRMPSVSGLKFYQELDVDIMVVFTTAYSEYAVEGFNLNAVDYLLKPFTFTRFLQAAEKANEFYRFRYHNEDSPIQYFFVRADYSLVKINLQDIMFIQGLDDYLKIHLESRKMVVTRMTMKSVLEKLPDKDFMRVHRSFIVPLSRIEKVRNKNIYLAEETIPIGASFEKDFFEVYKES